MLSLTHGCSQTHSYLLPRTCIPSDVTCMPNKTVTVSHVLVYACGCWQPSSGLPHWNGRLTKTVLSSFRYQRRLGLQSGWLIGCELVSGARGTCLRELVVAAGLVSRKKQHVVRLRPFPEIFVFSGGLNEEGWSQAAFERVFLVPLVPLWQTSLVAVSEASKRGH